jgi:hypothetical protein
MPVVQSKQGFGGEMRCETCGSKECCGADAENLIAELTAQRDEARGLVSCIVHDWREGNPFLYTVNDCADAVKQWEGEK